MSSFGEGVPHRCDVDLHELLRNAKVFEKDSSRPHKQMVRRGHLLYSTGNVAGNIPRLERGTCSLLDEVESAISLAYHSRTCPNGTLGSPDHGPAITNAKLFFNSSSTVRRDSVCDAVKGLCVELQLDVLDRLVLSLDTLKDEFESFLEIWQAADTLRRDGTIKELGLADVGAAQLQMILSTGIVPDVVENLYGRKNACDSQLLDVCQERGIRVVTHGDNNVDLTNSDGRFGKAFRTRLTGEGGFARTNFTPSWVVRYHRIVENRAVVVSMGYLVKAKYVIG